MSKNWERAWSTQEIVDNASNWKLAGDVGLFKHLEEFSEDLFTKANETYDNLNNLLDNLNATSIRLDLVKNEFLGLQNTQFIENRVYEDDETLQTQSEITEDLKVKDESKKTNLQNAVLEGLQILDKYYDKVSLPDSDSDDDEDDIRFILRPRDPYLDRPLPYVIGTEEWHKKWHVGLEESSSDSEAEKLEDKFSDTDSESNLPITDRRGISSESETDISNQFGSGGMHDTISSDGEDNTNSIPAKAPISNINFAEQLAAKLGNVIVQSREEEPVVNTRPIQKIPVNTNIGGLFSDEPPPIDEIDDVKTSQGMFSGGGGLFDESDDEPLWSTKPKEKKTVPNPKKSIQNAEKKKPGLFEEDEDEDDEDMFASSTSSAPKSILKPFNNAPPLISEEPPEIKEKTKNKKPIGGVAVMPGNKIGAMFPKRRQSSSEESTTSTDKKSEDNQKKNSLFDDSDDEFSSKPINKTNIFDEDIKPTIKNDEMQKSKEAKVPPSEGTIKVEKTKKVSLFDDASDDLFKDDLFTNANIKKFTSNLFDDLAEGASQDIFNNTPEAKKKKPTLFDDDDSNDIFGGAKPVESKTSHKVRNLFDDDSSDEDLLNTNLPSQPKTNETKNDPGNITCLHTEESHEEIIASPSQQDEIKTDSKLTFNLFQNTSPPDDWETKSDDDLFDDILSGTIKKSIFDPPKSGLFDEEAPSNLFDKAYLFNEDSTPPPIDNNTRERTPFEDEIHSRNLSLFEDESSNYDRKSFERSGSHLFFDEEPPSLDEDMTDTERKTETCNDLKKSANVMQAVSKDSKKNITLFSEDKEPLKQNYIKKEPSSKRDSEQITTSSHFIGNSEIVQKPSLFDEDQASRFMNDADSKLIAQKTKISLFEDEQDLFSNRRHESKIDVKSEQAENLSKNSDPLFAENVNPIQTHLVVEKNEKKEAFKTENEPNLNKPPVPKKISLFDANASDDDFITSPKQGNVVNLVKQTEESPKSIVISEQKVSPGKLKHNLNINVGALMPGAVLPKKKELVKSQSLEEPKDENNVITTHSYSTKNVNSEEPEGSSTLHSITKSRARIQVKRKPSTRRARHASMKKALEETNNSESSIDCDSDFVQPENNSHNEIKRAINRPIPTGSELKDENTSDLFRDILFDKSESTKEKNAPINDSFEDNSLFSQNSAEVNLFDENPLNYDGKLSTKENRTTFLKNSSNFDDDDDDDLFKDCIKSQKSPKGHDSFKQLDRKVEGMESPKNVEDTVNKENNTKLTAQLPKFEEIKERALDIKSDSKSLIFDDSNKLSNESKTKSERNVGISLFEDSDDSDIFSSKSKPKMVQSIFDDDDEDGLFTKPQSSGNASASKKVLGKKGSLFDDVSDDEDIFASSSSKSSNRTNVAVVKKGRSVVKKSGESKVVDDPLDAFK